MRTTSCQRTWDYFYNSRPLVTPVDRSRPTTCADVLSIPTPICSRAKEHPSDGIISWSISQLPIVGRRIVWTNENKSGIIYLQVIEQQAFWHFIFLRSMTRDASENNLKNRVRHNCTRKHLGCLPQFTMRLGVCGFERIW